MEPGISKDARVVVELIVAAARCCLTLSPMHAAVASQRSPCGALARLFDPVACMHLPTFGILAKLGNSVHN